MSRLRATNPDEFDDEQRELFAVLEKGGLAEQFGAYLLAPELSMRLISVGNWFRLASVSRRLLELAICTVTRQWDSEFAFERHRAVAIDEGIAPAALEQIRANGTPTFDRDDERLVHAISTQLVRSGRVDDDTFAAASEFLGEQGMYEVVAIVGFYSSMSMILNAFNP